MVEVWREKAVKRFSISAFFPEVKPAHAAFQSCTAKALDMSTALSRGMTEIRSRDELKGKHITEARVTIKEIAADCEVSLRE